RGARPRERDRDDQQGARPKPELHQVPLRRQAVGQSVGDRVRSEHDHGLEGDAREPALNRSHRDSSRWATARSSGAADVMIAGVHGRTSRRSSDAGIQPPMSLRRLALTTVAVLALMAKSAHGYTYGDTLTTIWRPLPNLPAMARPGDAF